MEDDTITPSDQYVKGFNEGYLINEHMPELSAPLAKAYGLSEKGIGFSDGWKQSLLEQIKDRSNELDLDNGLSDYEPNSLEDKDQDIEFDR